MAQKDYSVSLKLGNPNKSDDCKVYIRISGEGKEIKIPTIVKVKKANFNGKKVVDDPLSDDLNNYLDGELLKVKKIILDARIKEQRITPDLFNTKASREKLSTYIKKYLEDISNKDTRKGVRSVLNKLPDVGLNEIGEDFLNKLEKRLRADGLDINTINSQMKRTKTFILHLIDKEVIHDLKVVKSLTKYHVPNYVQKIPEYLTENEIADFFELVRKIKNETKKTSGYYFLLSCFTGWRLSDLKSFEYEKRIRGDKVILRAGKNNKIVSIVIYPDLAEVLNFCKDNKIDFSEKEFREAVKNLASDIGINQVSRNIKIHSGRHSFCMLLISKGFSIDEVAEMIGDSNDVARVYARITNAHLDNKVRQLLF